MGRIKITIEILNEVAQFLLHPDNISYAQTVYYTKIIQQILDDHEKAGKVDDMYIRVGQLIQENEQLKEIIYTKDLKLNQRQEIIIELEAKIKHWKNVLYDRNLEVNNLKEELGQFKSVPRVLTTPENHAEIIKENKQLKEDNKKKEIALLDVAQQMRWDELAKHRILKINDNLKNRIYYTDIGFEKLEQEIKAFKEMNQKLLKELEDYRTSLKYSTLVQKLEQENKQLKEELDRLYNPDIQNHLHDNLKERLEDSLNQIGFMHNELEDEKDIKEEWVKGCNNLKQKLEEIRKISINQEFSIVSQVQESLKEILDSQETPEWTEKDKELYRNAKTDIKSGKAILKDSQEKK